MMRPDEDEKVARAVAVTLGAMILISSALSYAAELLATL